MVECVFFLLLLIKNATIKKENAFREKGDQLKNLFGQTKENHIA